MRARIRGQWCVFKETFPFLASLLLAGILISAERGGDDRNMVNVCVREKGQRCTDRF